MNGLILVGPGADADVSPDLSAVAYTSIAPGALGSNTKVIVASLDGTHVAERPNSQGCSSPSWDPTGDNLVVDCGDVGRLYVLPKDGVDTVALTSDADPEESWYIADWSPDGQWISSHLSTGAQSGDPRDGIYVLKADCVSEPETCIPRSIGPYRLFGPTSWGPDSLRLAVAQADGTIQILSISSAEIENLATLGAYGPPESVAWSQSGNWIAFTQGESRTDPALDLFIVNISSGAITKLVESDQDKYVVDIISVQ